MVGLVWFDWVWFGWLIWRLVTLFLVCLFPCLEVLVSLIGWLLGWSTGWCWSSSICLHCVKGRSIRVISFHSNVLGFQFRSFSIFCIVLSSRHVSTREQGYPAVCWVGVFVCSCARGYACVCMCFCVYFKALLYPMGR